MKTLLTIVTLGIGLALGGLTTAQASDKKPNILVIFGDDIGYMNVSSFGGDPKQSSFIPIHQGLELHCRLYRPRAENLDGSWKFPAAQAVN
jgi:hypothetical protein